MKHLLLLLPLVAPWDLFNQFSLWQNVQLWLCLINLQKFTYSIVLKMIYFSEWDLDIIFCLLSLDKAIWAVKVGVLNI